VLVEVLVDVEVVVLVVVEVEVEVEVEAMAAHASHKTGQMDRIRSLIANTVETQ